MWRETICVAFSSSLYACKNTFSRPCISHRMQDAPKDLLELVDLGLDSLYAGLLGLCRSGEWEERRRGVS